MRFILPVNNFRLHPDVHSLYTRMYRSCTPRCIKLVHRGVCGNLQRAVIRLRKWTNWDELQGKEGTNSSIPQKY